MREPGRLIPQQKADPGTRGVAFGDGGIHRSRVWWDPARPPPGRRADLAGDPPEGFQQDFHLLASKHSPRGAGSFQGHEPQLGLRTGEMGRASVDHMGQLPFGHVTHHFYVSHDQSVDQPRSIRVQNLHHSEKDLFGGTPVVPGKPVFGIELLDGASSGVHLHHEGHPVVEAFQCLRMKTANGGSPSHPPHGGLEFGGERVGSYRRPGLGPGESRPARRGQEENPGQEPPLQGGPVVNRREELEKGAHGWKNVPWR